MQDAKIIGVPGVPLASVTLVALLKIEAAWPSVWHEEVGEWLAAEVSHNSGARNTWVANHKSCMTLHSFMIGS